jgi:hypothetical protein
MVRLLAIVSRRLGPGSQTAPVRSLYDSRPPVRNDGPSEQRGFFRLRQTCRGQVVFERVTNLSLNYFNSQNVLSELQLRQNSDGYQLTLEPCHGIDGTMAGDGIPVTFETGIPGDSRSLPRRSTFTGHSGPKPGGGEEAPNPRRRRARTTGTVSGSNRVKPTSLTA